MPKKARVLPHPSTLVEKQPDDDVLFRERYKALKGLVYEIEDENNIIGFRAAQARARVAALRSDYAQRQEDAKLEKERPNSEIDPARQYTTTPPHSPPRRHDSASQSSQPPPVLAPLAQSGPSAEAARFSLPQLSLIPSVPVPVASASPPRGDSRPPSSNPAAKPPAPRPTSTSPHKSQTGPVQDTYPARASSGDARGHSRAQSNASSAHTIPPSASVAGSVASSGLVRKHAPLVGPNGEEDELMSD